MRSLQQIAAALGGQVAGPDAVLSWDPDTAQKIARLPSGSTPTHRTALSVTATPATTGSCAAIMCGNGLACRRGSPATANAAVFHRTICANGKRR